MTAVRLMLESEMSIRKALGYAGMSSCSYYYEPVARRFEPDPAVVEKVKELALQRPFYSTRRMAAQLSRELPMPVNRKRVQKVFRTLNWMEPAKTKSQILRSSSRVVKASRPYEFWQTDLTYLWCGIDRWPYLFNVIDVFHREWLGYAFETSAVKEHAIMSVNNALASHGEVVPEELTLRCDNGPQYTSHAFKDSMDALGLRLEYILYHTPEQNGFVESFHKTLKKEYIWPRDLRSYQEAEAAIEDAFIDYNQRRIHSPLGYFTPYEYLDAVMRLITAVYSPAPKSTHRAASSNSAGSRRSEIRTPFHKTSFTTQPSRHRKSSVSFTFGKLSTSLNVRTFGRRTSPLTASFPSFESGSDWCAGRSGSPLRLL